MKKSAAFVSVFVALVALFTTSSAYAIIEAMVTPGCAKYSGGAPASFFLDDVAVAITMMREAKPEEKVELLLKDARTLRFGCVLIDGDVSVEQIAAIQNYGWKLSAVFVAVNKDHINYYRSAIPKVLAQFTNCRLADEEEEARIISGMRIHEAVDSGCFIIVIVKQADDQRVNLSFKFVRNTTLLPEEVEKVKK